MKKPKKKKLKKVPAKKKTKLSKKAKKKNLSKKKPQKKLKALKQKKAPKKVKISLKQKKEELEKKNKEKLKTLKLKKTEEIILTNEEGIPYCKYPNCDKTILVEDYCRYHYLYLWNNLRERKRVLESGELRIYIEEFVEQLPQKCLLVLLKDLKTPKSFSDICQQMFQDDEPLEPSFSEDFLSEEIQGISKGQNHSKEEEIY